MRKNFTDALFEAYENTSYLAEDIAAVKKQFSYIPEDDFDKIIRLDPTFKEERNSVGKYGKWLLGLYKKDNPLNFPPGNLRGIITEYDAVKNNRAKKVEKDISKFKSIKDMFDATKQAEDVELSSRQKLRQKRADENYDIVYEDEDWTVYVPNTWEAEVNLGAGADWCTADSREDYGKKYYYKYLEEYGGKYYIIINKHYKSEKYKFHFESEQFMDSADDPVYLPEFFENNPQLEEFFVEQGYNLDSLTVSFYDIIMDSFTRDELEVRLSYSELVTILRYLDNRSEDDLIDYGELIDLYNGVYDEIDIADIFSYVIETIFFEQFLDSSISKPILAKYKELTGEADIDLDELLEIFKDVFSEDLSYNGLDEVNLQGHIPQNVELTPDGYTTVKISKERLAELAQDDQTDLFSEDAQYVHDIDDFAELIRESVVSVRTLDNKDLIIAIYALSDINIWEFFNIDLNLIIEDYYNRNKGQIASMLLKFIEEHVG